MNQLLQTLRRTTSNFRGRLRPTEAFTLMELLIVIAILGILMGLLFPAVNGALDSARKAQAKNDVVQIANAVVMFETEYGRLPGVSANSDYSGNVSGPLVQTLTGENTNSNARKIVFLEVPAAKPKKSGTNSNGDYIDPWGNNYKIAIDGDYNNQVTAKGTNIRKKVAVWNEPSGSSSNRRAVTSWD